jgi:hypothetical protein
MKRQNLLLVVWVIWMMFAASASGEADLQRAKPGDGTVETYSQEALFAPANNVVEMVFCYSFFVPGETSKVKLVVALPRTIPERQNIRRIECFPKPLREFSSKSGNRYAEFIITEPQRQFDVEVHIEAELLRCDLSTKLKKHEEEFSPGYEAEDFPQDEGGNDPLIRGIAGDINGQSEIEMVKGIYDYVINNMEYSIYDGEGGASYAVQQKSGDCSEYSDLFVALCRAEGIPARVVVGYTVQVDENDLPKHAWAEVYLEDYGWVPFDPTWGDQEEPRLREALFHTMKPVYIYNKYPDKDEVINNIGDITYWWIGDEIEMEESLKFERWEWERPALKAKTVTTKPQATYGVVGGIMYAEDNPLAIIDGEILKEGDTVHGVKIVKIYEAKVEFEKDSRRWTQQVGEKADEFWQ